ncbi:MAG: phosphatidate cytidylyltransferase [Gammaproteobacteria bacterium]|jgi:phosphatidate cytidylyltransferase|nr:phosphatidate cytidylyltransferase [Gammaproteobacteria bacterium]MBT5204284.1 phosphatidate cytidylyltransferase [Gammaproteobacteria bacterium]MBT5603776.1 phosphatidate cytidylyltransferase [Gammaproteobacteria bacterium]MBT6243806.1 phosphatidate cytidylyltransferase [Gammaproteobacteria bacterium]
MLKQRIITALLIAPLGIGCIFFLSDWGFALFVAVVIAICGWEWANFARLGFWFRIGYGVLTGVLLLVLLLEYTELQLQLLASLWWLTALLLVVNYPRLTGLWNSPAVILLCGWLVLIPCGVVLVSIKQFAESDFLFILLFFLIWSADIGAYFCGRRWGKIKLLPRVSPGKSREGLYGGACVAVMVGLASGQWLGGLSFVPGVQMAYFALACLGVVLVSVLGDLTVSMFKRERGIKDSSQLLPGHGGFLDRLDSLFSAAPVFFLLLPLLTKSPVS